MDKSIVSPFFDSRCIAIHTLVVWSVIDRMLQWTRPRRKSIASTSINMPEIRTRYMPWK